MAEDFDQRIIEFKARIEVDGREFCEELFKYATIRLLAHKYAYYVASNSYIKDLTYDLEEKGWWVMGRALELIAVDDTSPCIDFDHSHPLAFEGEKLAKSLMKNLTPDSNFGNL